MMETANIFLPEGYDPSLLHEENPWEILYQSRQNKTIIEEEVWGIEKIDGTPYLIMRFGEVGEILGRLPLDESGFESEDQMRDQVGQRLQVVVIALNEKEKLVGLSRKEAIRIRARQFWKRVGEGKTMPAVVRRVSSKQLVLDLGGYETTMSKDELSWGFVDDAKRFAKIGQPLNVKVMKVDRQNQTVSVSHRMTKKDPWPQCMETFLPKKGEYRGRVTGVASFGVFVNLVPGVDCLAPRPTLPRGVKLNVHDRVLIEIERYDVENRKVYGNITKKM